MAGQWPLFQDRPVESTGLQRRRPVMGAHCRSSPVGDIWIRPYLKPCRDVGERRGSQPRTTAVMKILKIKAISASTTLAILLLTILGCSVGDSGEVGGRQNEIGQPSATSETSVNGTPAIIRTPPSTDAAVAQQSNDATKATSEENAGDSTVIAPTPGTSIATKTPTPGSRANSGAHGNGADSRGNRWR